MRQESISPAQPKMHSSLGYYSCQSYLGQRGSLWWNSSQENGIMGGISVMQAVQEIVTCPPGAGGKECLWRGGEQLEEL